VTGTQILDRDVLELLRAGCSFEAITTEYYSDLELADVQAYVQSAIDTIDADPTMDRTKIHVDLPRELMTLLDVPEGDLGETLLLLAVLQLVREGHIPTGTAAELLGFSKATFIEHMGARDVPYFTDTPEELDALRALDDDGAES